MFSKKIGIDLGTANSIVYLQGKGIVLNEPTVVAVTVDKQKVVAVGNKAKEMLGRTPENIIASRPMKEGVIADYQVTQAMLRYFLQKVCGKAFLFKPEVMICIPAGSTQVERRAVEDAAQSAGAKAVYILHEPLAAAIGAEIPIAEASGNMILDVGGGAAEAAVISLGGVVVSESTRVGGNKLDEAIADYVRKKHNLIIGENTAEKVKLEIGAAIEQQGKKDKTAEIKGRDSVSGLPRRIEINTNDVVKAMEKPLGRIINNVKDVLEKIPPELASDIVDKGIVMTGGTSLLKDFDKLLSESTGVPCYVADDPMLSVAKGCGVVLDNLEKYKKSVIKG
jgi:rod shape-determining protein MreB